MTLCTLTLAFATAFAQQADSVSRWGVSLSAMKGKVVATDQYVKKWLKRGDNLSLALELMRAQTAMPLPPTMAIRLSLSACATPLTMR